MRKDLIDIVCCPEDKAKLTLEGERLDDHGDVVSGTLRCTECGFGYPVEDGIPNLLPPAYHVRTGKKAAKTSAKKAAPGPAGAPTAGTAKGAPDAAGTGSARDAGAAKPDASPEREAVADGE